MIQFYDLNFEEDWRIHLSEVEKLGKQARISSKSFSLSQILFCQNLEEI